MNTPIKFELAKLLKEKGFDKITESLWHFNGSECIKMPNKNSENLGFSAPTIADVVMWLYEKHDVWVSVQRDWDVGKCLGFEAIIDDNDGSINTETFNSPTEAYEAAIEYTLNNLI